MSGSANDKIAEQINVLTAEIKNLKQQNEALTERERRNSDLLATVSHEIRTPIGAIVSMVELLETTTLNEIQSHYTRTLSLAAQNLSTLTNDLLSFAKLEGNQIELEPQNFQIETFIETLVTSIEPRATAKGLAFKTEIEPNCPRELYADPVRISQIINNLVNNALKFTDQGMIELKVEALEVNENDSTVRVSLSDTGIGINQEEREKIFSPFAQASVAINATYGGSGLGLWISRQLAKLMGGELDCISEPQKGSTFWFTFKAKIAESQTVSNAAPSTKDLNGHALIVEDNALNQLLIKTYLDNFGLSHHTVANGVEALDAIKKEHYDIILMDMMMPVMDGLTTTKEMHKYWGDTPKAPILALSANVLEDQVQTYLDAGMNAFVPKPIKAEVFYNVLNQLLNTNVPEQQNAANS